MDGQELYNLYEAYLEVYMDEGLRVLPREKMQSKASSKRRKALTSALKSKFTTGKGTTERNVIDAKNKKLRSQADKMDQVAGDYTPSGSRNKEAKNRGGSSNPRNRMGSDEYAERQFAKNRAMLGIGEQVDLYDIILSHLLDEGYAETPEAAESIMVNMSEEWRYSILEKKRQYDDGHGFDRSKHPDLEIDYDRPRGKTEDPGYPGYTRIKHKPSGIEYEIQHSKKHGNYNLSSDLKGKARKAHGHKPEHNVRWSHDREFGMSRGDKMSRGDRIKTARNAKRVWDKHIQHRIPSGHLVSNEPDENPDDNRRNPEKNTRASIYQKSGFGKTNRMGKQYSTKIGKKLHPVNDDED